MLIYSALCWVGLVPGTARVFQEGAKDIVSRQVRVYFLLPDSFKCILIALKSRWREPGAFAFHPHNNFVRPIIVLSFYG